MTAGDVLGPFVIESVSAENMKRLAVVLDDPNPIHLDPEATRALGLGDRVDAVEDGRATCSVWLEVDGGSRAVDGSATLILPSD